MALRTFSLTALPVLAASCASGDPDTSVATANLADCEDIICGNSPVLGGQPFWELDQSMKDYSPVGGFLIKSFKSAGNIPLIPRVTGFGLTGISASNAMFSGVALEGSKLVIESRGGAQYQLEIEVGGVGSIPFFEGGKDGTTIPTYRWRYFDVKAPPPTGPLTFLCPSDGIKLGTKDAIVFAGDRYSQMNGTVDHAAVGTWFNIACNNDALWKMAEFRYVQAAQKLPMFKTDLADRNAALKAIRADYCGNNHPWTEIGTPIDWGNPRHWLWVSDPDFEKVEAIWDQDKAFCLSNPRKYSRDDINCWPDDVPPLCTPDQVDNWIADGHLMITYLP